MPEIIRPRKTQPSNEHTDPTAHATPRKKRFTLLELIPFVLILAVIAGLGVTLLQKLSLKNEVSASKTVAERVLHDISSKNAKDTLSVSDAKFKSAHPEAQLQELLKTASTFATGTPTIVNQTVANGNGGKLVVSIYKYDGKSPYYFRLSVSETKGSSWQLVGLSGNPDESQLVVK